jgi:hypothetical protein
VVAGWVTGKKKIGKRKTENGKRKTWAKPANGTSGTNRDGVIQVADWVRRSTVAGEASSLVP